MIKRQIDSILSDFAVDVINIGMVYDSNSIRAICSSLKRAQIPVVLDPVITSTTGGTLLRRDAMADYARQMVPLAHVITPNVREAEILSGTRIRDYEGLGRAAEKIAGMGAENVVITGHRFERGRIGDFVYSGGTAQSVSGRVVAGRNHGSGCNFSIALAHQVAGGHGMVDSVRFAKKFAFDSIRSSLKIGHGAKITRPRMDALRSELQLAIMQFQAMRGAARLIPEVQTNFVYARSGAKKITDVAGVRGRIVRAGDSVIVAGNLEYGGSRHVATAVLAAQKKFRQIRSAANIRFDEGTIEKMLERRCTVLNYDRSREPPQKKARENSTVMWGMQSAIRDARSAPDAVYHRGDVGKEPMIIIFGTSPSDVLEKIKSVI